MISGDVSSRLTESCALPILIEHLQNVPSSGLEFESKCKKNVYFADVRLGLTGHSQKRHVSANLGKKTLPNSKL